MALNKCNGCGHTWHPRGRNVSLRCPSCGERDVGYAPNPLVQIIVFLLMLPITIVVTLAGLSTSTRQATVRNTIDRDDDDDDDDDPRDRRRNRRGRDVEDSPRRNPRHSRWD